MGYMGFGMRKEVYTRKAKKAFSKAREIYGRTIGNNEAAGKIEATKPVSYEKHSYKPFFETKTYINFKRSAMLIVLVIFLLTAFSNTIYKKWRLHQFEVSGFKEFYQNEMPDVQKVFEFLNKRKEKMNYAYYNTSNQKYNIQLWNFATEDNISEYSLERLVFDGNKMGHVWNTDSISGQTLFVKRSDESRQAFEKNWKYQLSNVTPSQIPLSIVHYLEADHSNFLEFLARLERSELRFQITSDYGFIICQYDHEEFGAYEIIYSDSFHEEHTQHIKQYMESSDAHVLGKNVFWTKNSKAFF